MFVCPPCQGERISPASSVMNKFHIQAGFFVVFGFVIYLVMQRPADHHAGTNPNLSQASL